MNADKTEKVGRSKALIAVAAALACLIIYMLACVLSPVTWSPDSSKIALLVTPPGDEPEFFAIFTYDIATGEHVLLDKVEKNGFLSAPAWSPDGKWIAYYKVDPAAGEKTEPAAADPNTTAPPTKPTQQPPGKETTTAAKEQTRTTVTGEELFSEENKMLPPFLFELIEEKMQAEKDHETFDVKLMLVTPDGKKRKSLRVMQFGGDENDHAGIVFMKPQWSKDGKSLFYARLFRSKMYYAGSLNINTGETYAYFLSTLGTPAVSPDGEWITSLLGDTLIAARTDGKIYKYFKIDELTDEEVPPVLPVTWSPDSKQISVPVENKLCLLDTITGQIQMYPDPSTDQVGYGAFAPIGRQLYYLAEYESPDPNRGDEKLAISSISLEDNKVKVVTYLPDVDQLGMFSVSPNGKMFLVRAVLKDDEQNKKSVLIFWDGKEQKIVETDPWLIEALKNSNPGH